MTPAEFLYTRQVFSREELVEALASTRARAPESINKLLQRWCATGVLKPVRRGVFVRLQAVPSATQTVVDPLLLASRLAPDAVLAYHTALEALGQAQSPFERFYFATFTRTRGLMHDRRAFVPVLPRAQLRSRPLTHTVQIERSGVRVAVTSLERTLVDVLDRPELAGGIEEAWRSIASIEALDFDALRRYSSLITRPVLAARLGFALESHASRWLTPSRLLAALEAQRPAGPVSLDRAQRGRFVTRWNLVVPPELLPPSEESSDGDVPGSPARPRRGIRRTR
jgi:predicted transcriptional regulator of viral defense system